MHVPHARFLSSTGAFLAAVLVSVSLLLAAPHAVLAQSTSASASTAKPPKAPLQADLKGVIGVGLIGAELGFVLPAVAGLDDVWAFIVFPVIGAGGGAAAGYFAIEKGNHATLAVASLTLGMALVIPAVLITAAETAYDPSEDEVQSGMSASASSGQSNAVARADAARARARDPRRAGSGLVRVAEGGVAVATPAVAVTPDARTRNFQIADVQLSLLSGRF